MAKPKVNSRFLSKGLISILAVFAALGLQQNITVDVN